MSNSRFHPAHIEVTVINENKYGSVIEIEGDARLYTIAKGQRWVPHPIPNNSNPAKVGDIVALSRWLEGQLGFGVAMVSNTRCMKNFKHRDPVYQVELLGLPLRWFHISHFDEYHDKPHGPGPDARWRIPTSPFNY